MIFRRNNFGYYGIISGGIQNRFWGGFLRYVFPSLSSPPWFFSPISHSAVGQPSLKLGVPARRDHVWTSQISVWDVHQAHKEWRHLVAQALYPPYRAIGLWFSFPATGGVWGRGANLGGGGGQKNQATFERLVREAKFETSKFEPLSSASVSRGQAKQTSWFLKVNLEQTGVWTGGTL